MLLLPWARKRLLDNPKRLGRWGQNTSQKYLTRRGCKTLARNYAFTGGELDLVMADPNGAIVFVEVKTRQSETFAPAKDAVNYKKQQKDDPNRKALSERIQNFRQAFAIRHYDGHSRSQRRPRHSTLSQRIRTVDP